MYTVGQLSKKFKLSRTALLYYDRIGLLRPSERTQAGYRVYSEKDAQRLEQICTYRDAGLRLAEIREAFEGPSTALAEAMERRLEELNADIQRLRNQQRLIVGLLKNKRLMERIGVMNKDTWVSLLEAAGFSETDMECWHADFERVAPEKHQQFLEFLCIPEQEIAAIREWSRGKSR